MSGAEKRGGDIPSTRNCGKFQDIINGCNRMDLGSSEYKYTRRAPINHGGYRVYERLDRVLGNDQWRLQFPKAQVKVLTRLEFSDHLLVLLSLVDDSDRNFPKSF